jgi:hypothetical protein
VAAAGQGQSWRFYRTLSGRFLLLTVAFVMLAEVLIFLPSIARFRYDVLTERLKMAQIAARRGAPAGAVIPGPRRDCGQL